MCNDYRLVLFNYVNFVWTYSLFVKETLGQTREISYYENFSKVPVFHTLKLFGTINQYS